MSPNDITGIHHVGLIVTDMVRAIATFERLGFNVKAPAFAALPPSPGETPQPIGASNCHADFPRNFIELVGLAPESREQLPEGAKLIPLDIPEDRLEATAVAVRATVANISTRLTLGEGAHILVFASRDAERTATRMTEAGIDHGGARGAQRPIITAEGTQLADIKYLEINEDDPTAPTGLVPEGRVGVAEDAPAEMLDAQLGLTHPNGAVGLAECVISVGENEFDTAVGRYERYLGVGPTMAESSATFDLGASRVVVMSSRQFGATFPGENATWGPDGNDAMARIAAYGVEVADLTQTKRFLGTQGIELSRCGDDRVFVPGAVAHGAAIAFG